MHTATFTKQADGKSMVIERDFSAPLKQVWAAFTTQIILEQWWAPKPFFVKTKEFNFCTGGRWLYAMVGPGSKEYWSLEEYKEIETMKRFSANDYFCDETGTLQPDMPQDFWENEFLERDNNTYLKVTLRLKTEEELTKLSDMGFKEGFTMSLNQLEIWLEKHH